MTERLPNIGETSWHNVLGANDGTGGFLRVAHNDDGTNNINLWPKSSDNVSGMNPYFSSMQLAEYCNEAAGSVAVTTAALDAGYWMPATSYISTNTLSGPIFNTDFFYQPNSDWISIFVAQSPFSFDRVGTYVSTAEAGKSARLAVYAGTRYGQPTGAPLADVAVSISATGIQSASVTQVNCYTGVYLAMANTNATASTAFPNTLNMIPLGWNFSGTFDLIGQIKVSRAYGAFPGTHPGWASTDVVQKTAPEGQTMACPLLLHMV